MNKYPIAAMIAATPMNFKNFLNMLEIDFGVFPATFPVVPLIYVLYVFPL